MHFGFALDSSNINLWDIDLLDIDLDLLVGHGYIQISPVNILFVSKTSSRLFKICFQDVFKTCLQRLLEDVLRDVFKTSSRCICKTSLRRLQDVLEDEKLLRWRRIEEVFKTYLEDVFKTSWRPRNVCWVVSEFQKLLKKILKELNSLQRCLVFLRIFPLLYPCRKFLWSLQICLRLYKDLSK